MTNQIGKRPLPLLPNADHLRKQAKAMLVLMKAETPAARLADAQRLLAQEYGFTSWSGLQAEVVRRADGPLGRGIRKRRLLATLTTAGSRSANTADLFGWQRLKSRLCRFQHQAEEHSPLQFLRCGIIAQVSCLVTVLASIGIVCFALYRAGAPFSAIQNSSPSRIDILHKRI